MLGRSVTFWPKSIEKRPQQGNFFELTTPTAQKTKADLKLNCGFGDTAEIVLTPLFPLQQG